MTRLAAARWIGVLGLSLGFSALAPAAAQAPNPPASDPSAEGADSDSRDRSHELIRLDCFTNTGRRDVTLFGNGTARLRTEGSAGQGMALAELSAREVSDYIDLLAAVDLSEVPGELHGVRGESVERCVVALELPDRQRRELRFRSFDSLPLALARIVSIAGTIEDRIGPPRPRTRLPPRYEPSAGDVLRRNDGSLFRVIDRTVDGEGVELHGVDQPLVIYVPVDSLDEEMIELVERRDGRLGEEPER